VYDSVAVCRSWKRKLLRELQTDAALSAAGSDTKLVMEPMDEGGSRFVLRFGNSTIVL
jgi:hypothetical protein